MAGDEILILRKILPQLSFQFNGIDISCKLYSVSSQCKYIKE